MYRLSIGDLFLLPPSPKSRAAKDDSSPASRDTLKEGSVNLSSHWGLLPPGLFHYPSHQLDQRWPPGWCPSCPLSQRSSSGLHLPSASGSCSPRQGSCSRYHQDQGPSEGWPLVSGCWGRAGELLEVSLDSLLACGHPPSRLQRRAPGRSACPRAPPRCPGTPAATCPTPGSSVVCACWTWRPGLDGRLFLCPPTSARSSRWWSWPTPSRCPCWWARQHSRPRWRVIGGTATSQASLCCSESASGPPGTWRWQQAALHSWSSLWPHQESCWSYVPPSPTDQLPTYSTTWASLSQKVLESRLKFRHIQCNYDCVKLLTWSGEHRANHRGQLCG